MAWIRCSGTPTRPSSASRACFSLRSSSSAGTKRSSPHQTSTAAQSTVSRTGSAASAATCSRTAIPTPPPVSTTEAEPCTAWAAASRATSASAAARARCAGVRLDDDVGGGAGHESVLAAARFLGLLPLPLSSAGSNHTCSRIGERSARPVTPVADSSASL